MGIERTPIGIDRKFIGIDRKSIGIYRNSIGINRKSNVQNSNKHIESIRLRSSYLVKTQVNALKTTRSGHDWICYHSDPHTLGGVRGCAEGVQKHS